ncbi:MAG: hypothetical protein K8R40_02295 [Anaerolineaceae bacterium]|nr:hypothetical protein [Anaerolineaceae bacterium]
MSQEPIQTQAGNADGGAGLAPPFGRQPASNGSPTQPVGEPIAKGDGQEATPTYLTQEGLDKWWEGKEPDVLQSAGRKAQSVSDAAATKRQKLQDAALADVNANLKAIIDGGGSVPEAVQENMRKLAVQNAVKIETENKEIKEPQQLPKKADPEKQQEPAAPVSEAPPEWLDNKIMTLTVKEGFRIESSDPEAKLVDLSLMNSRPDIVYEQYEAGLKAKKERIMDTGSRAAAPGMGTGGSALDPKTALKDKSSMELMTMGYASKK